MQNFKTCNWRNWKTRTEWFRKH